MQKIAFWPWEIATHLPAAAAPNGFVPTRRLPMLTWVLFIGLSILLFPLFGLMGPFISLFFARQMALDLTTYTLADVYTLPAMAVAITAAFSHNALPEAALGALSMASLAGIVSVIQWLNGGKGLGMGGGDTKLLIAMGLWLGPVNGMVALAVGCILWWPFAWFKPKAQQPFGVAIGMGWLTLLCVPHLPNLLTLPI